MIYLDHVRYKVVHVQTTIAMRLSQTRTLFEANLDYW